MCKQTKNHRVVVLCPYCLAPTKLPKGVEKRIHDFESYDCWECDNNVPITKPLILFTQATRSVEDEEK